MAKRETEIESACSMVHWHSLAGRASLAQAAMPALIGCEILLAHKAWRAISRQLMAVLYMSEYAYRLFLGKNV